MLISEDLLHPKEGPACLSMDLCEKRHLQEESGTIPVDKQTPKSSSKAVVGLPHVFAVVKGYPHRGPRGFCEGWGAFGACVIHSYACNCSIRNYFSEVLGDFIYTRL